MSDEYLHIYEKYMKSRLPSVVKNQLRDVEEEFTKYSFSLNSHLIFSYDVCGGCEAHAILTAMHHGVRGNGTPRSHATANATATNSTTTVNSASNSTTGAIPASALDAAVWAAGLLKDLSTTQRKENIALKHCPNYD
jgi:hypothetical protein